MISAANRRDVVCNGEFHGKSKADLEDFYIMKMAKIANELLESHYSKMIKEWESISES